ncbi:MULTISPECIES: hypothetical protein [unclassified Snodgrassella]|uniref:hypothetical protein n=1 Tax=unclassified Snodgrassella TaxID=2625236 RepID=UPI0018DE12D0|nr:MULTISPECIES: hypothetical protein [unclassified Snodgrassella]MBI0159132.1 hypothetical protein [Snodgrassella sp. W6238H11]MBI0161317.1 hypothetical protein [Snodgrassella sp. W6238H14]
MKRIIFLIISLLMTFLLSSCAKHYKRVSTADYQLINSSDAKESLHVSLQIDDFYNPYLTHAENEDIKQKFPKKNIKIIANYEPITDKTGSIIKKTTKNSPPQFLSLKDILGIDDIEIVYNKINQYAFATNLKVNKDNQIINFDIPKPTKNNKHEYVLEGIYLYYPDFQFSKNPKPYYFRNGSDYYLPIFKNQIDINKLKGSVNRFMNVELLNLDIITDKFFDFTYDYDRTQLTNKDYLARNIVLNTSVWFSNDKPIKKKVLSNEEKGDLFDEMTISMDGQKYEHIVIPDSKLSWSDAEDIYGSYVKGKTFEVLQLKGQLSKYSKKGYYDGRRGKWVKQKGDMVYIDQKYGSHVDKKGCEFDYRIVFEKDNQPRRYILHSYKRSESNNKKFTIFSNKTYISQENLNFFEKTKQRKKESFDYSLRQIPVFYKNSDKEFRDQLILENQDLAQACMKEIDHMKRLMTMPKEDLMQEFEQYKKIINKENSKQR